ncbi:MAG: acyl-CoA thioesterase [Dysgonamonadaceae bacterium]|jgi:acyl-CoA thioester hydrolase|nr:acyl-CoA thioesterase [Dysgonamonadaceae bacterium]
MKPIFEYELKVRDYECDVQGHVNNANYQHYFEVTRHEFLERQGLNFNELHNDGIDAVVARVDIRYKSPLHGMDVFKCRIAAMERKRLSYVFHQEIVRLSDGKLCATGSIEVVCLINGKLSQPAVFDAAFAEYI